MLRPLQTKTFPQLGAQQVSAVPMQSSVLPAQTSGTTSGIDINSLFNLMITMMIVVMMMKMMAQSMEGLNT